MKDLSVLRRTPFTDRGNIVELFGKEKGLWNGIKQAIERVNGNAAA